MNHYENILATTVLMILKTRVENRCHEYCVRDTKFLNIALDSGDTYNGKKNTFNKLAKKLTTIYLISYMCNVMIIIENMQNVKTKIFLVYVFCFVYKQ